jgi:predicted dehydrogenase
MVRLGILGCGAITNNQHLPAAVENPTVHITALVDANLGRAEALRRAYGLDCRLSANFYEILDDVDAVINALPNSLHGPVNLQALEAGVHVLCEKPLATTVDEARVSCEMAALKGVVLAVSMPRRYYESSLVLPLVLKEGLLGSLRSYEWEHGTPFVWPTASGFYFSRELAGGGVLLDDGVHLLDCLLDWFGPVTSFEYQDDNWGSGIEANALLALHHAGIHGDVSGRVRLSRTYSLKNRLVIRGTQARAEIMRSEPAAVFLYRSVAGQEVSMAIRLPEMSSGGTRQAFRAQLCNFVGSIEGTCMPAVPGAQALKAIELIKGCYAHAARIAEPWFEQTERSIEVSK